MKRAFLLLLVPWALSSCDWMPGKPKLENKWKAPSEITSFATLYSQNCLGCHGDGLSVAGSNTLNDPLYLSLLTPEKLRAIIAKGVPGYNMPAFAQSQGGQLTDPQIEILVQGLMAWKNPAKIPPGPIPPYEAPLGNPTAGKSAFAQSCASCHGAEGTGVAGKAGSVVDPDYLTLVSDQYLRTITITGRPDLGCPDFAHRTPPLTPPAVSDIVAWLASQRVNEFHQPVQP